MPEPAFLVEGQMEMRIIQSLCSGKTVRRIGCNGDQVTMEAMSRFVDSHMRLLKNFFPVIIVFDRERRDDTCEVLRQRLSHLLDNKGHSGKYVIGVADRTTENWILADWESIRARRPEFGKLNCGCEGTHGKAVIKKLLPKGQLYNETTLGAELFCIASAIRMYENSPSFRMLIDQLTIACRWLTGITAEFIRSEVGTNTESRASS